MNILKLAAFSHMGEGGNPAGVVFCDNMPAPEKMLETAKKVGYSQTAFLMKHADRGIGFMKLNWIFTIH